MSFFDYRYRESTAYFLFGVMLTGFIVVITYRKDPVSMSAGFVLIFGSCIVLLVLPFLESKRSSVRVAALVLGSSALVILLGLCAKVASGRSTEKSKSAEPIQRREISTPSTATPSTIAVIVPPVKHLETPQERERGEPSPVKRHKRRVIVPTVETPAATLRTEAREPRETETTKRPEVVVFYQDHKLFIQNTADTSVILRATSYDGGPLEIAPRIIPRGAYYYIYTDTIEARLAAELSHPGFFQKEWDLYLTPQGNKEEFVSKWLLVFTVDEHGWRIDTQNIAVDSANIKP